jgi:hypothetical protein
VAGSADTARIRLEVAPDGARVELDDIGLSATSSLTTGRYEVSGSHLSLAAGLAQDGQPVGSVDQSWPVAELDGRLLTVGRRAPVRLQAPSS